MIYIYALKLESDKYYIGKTTNPDVKFETHVNSNKSKWIKKYKPIEIIEIIPDCDHYDEDKYTLKYMEKFGINNVRGGTFSDQTLGKQSTVVIQKMISRSKYEFVNNQKRKQHDVNDLDVSFTCKRCFRTGHTELRCYAKTNVNNKYIGDSYYSDDSDNELYYFVDDSEDDMWYGW